MKISNKISFLIFFLLAVLAANTFVGLSQLAKVGWELNDVANKDVVLTEAITSINQHQLEKAILFERVIRVAEEIGFEAIAPARRQYLLGYLDIVRQGFENLSRLIEEDLVLGRSVVERGLAQEESGVIRGDLKQVQGLFNDIGQTHRQYDILVTGILDSLSKGNYQFSIEDVEGFEQQEAKLSGNIKSLMKKIQGFTRVSVLNADRAEKLASRILQISLVVSLLMSAILMWAIIRSIVQPLKKLETAARQIGSGDWNVRLDVVSRDEIGEVSSAFDTMAKRLREAHDELKKKNDMLAENLAVTDSQKKNLEKMNLELDTFVHTVSHDIRAPLTGIAGYGSYLEKYYYEKLDKKGKDCIAGILKAVKRLNSLIEDLLSLAAISRVKSVPEEIRVDDLIDSIRSRLDNEIHQAGVAFRVQPDLPTIFFDRVKLGSVFFNLISNAVKFSVKAPNGSPLVEVGYTDRGKVHEFFVKDNGIGIDPQHHLQIFEVFKKLHPPSEYPGTGAGLSMVKGVIDDCGGKIWVESRPGAGAIFYFTVPKQL